MYRQLLISSIFTVFANLLYSQTGPAGVGNSTSNILWLDAQNSSSLSSSLVDDDPVTTWSDLSGNGNDFVQQDSDPVPYFRSDGLDAGSFNVVQFDGTERYLVLEDNDDLDLDLDEFTIIGVYNRTATDTSPRGILSKRSSYSSQVSYYIYTYTDNNFRFNLYTSSNTGAVSSSTTVSGDNLFAVSYDGAQQSIFLASDNEASVSKSGTVNNSTSKMYMGALNNNYGTYFNGELAEIIMFRTALNDGERLVIENYLAQKYGLSITNDFFGNYADYVSSYDDDLRGVGTGNGSDTHETSGFSSGLQLQALSGLNSTNEFVIFAHDASVAHSDGSTSNIAAADISSGDITDRWAKDYYLEVTQGGVIDAATIELEFTFDFSEAGLTYSGSSSDYVLLYRASTSDDYSRVFAYDYVLENGDQIVVSIPSSRLQSGYYTLGRGDQLTSRKWYVLQNGDWSDPDTWTLDAGSAPIPNNPSSEIPGEEDDVIIRNGKTVTIQSTTNNLMIGSITVDGLLNVTTSYGHDFNQIDGQGTIRISGYGGVSNFPDGATTSSNGFGNVANGGLLSIRGSGFTFDEDATFKDVRILLDDPANVIELGADLTINGDFDVRYGTFQFGDGAGVSRTFTVLGDFSIENNGGTQDGYLTTAYVASSGARHQFNLYGDFLNEGTAQFSDRTTTDYSTESTNGVVDLNLLSTTDDQQVDCNGLTYFYRIEIVKGSTDFTASIEADDPGDFVLTGYANDNVDSDVDEDSDNDNAFGLITGSVSLGTNVTVRLNITGNYSIGSNAKLIINGADVAKTGGQAITVYGIIEVLAGALEVTPGSGITTRGDGQLIVSGGEVWIPQFRTSTQGSIAQGGYEQDGGTVYIGDFTSGPVTGSSSSSASESFYTMSLTYTGNSFTMSGGTLYIQDQTSKGMVFINSNPDNVSVTGGTVILTSTNSNEAIITSKASFYNLTLRANGSSRGNFMLKSGTTGTTDSRTLGTQDLTVINDLIVKGYGGTVFTNANNSLGDYATTLEASSLDDLSTSDTSDDSLYVADVYIGGSFYIGQNADYVSAVDGNDGNSSVNPGGTDLITNTYFYQSDATVLYEYFGWDNTSALSTGHITIDRTTEYEVRFESTSSTGALRYDIFGDLEVLSGTLDQHSSSIRPRAGIVNNDRLGTYYTSGSYPVSGGTPEAARVMMFADDVTVDEDGAIFGNVELNVNHNYYLEFIGDVTFERLDHARGNIYIGSNNLTIDEYVDLAKYRYTQYTTPQPGDADETWIETPEVSSLLRVEDVGRYDVGEGNNLDQRSMIITDGNASDGGVSLKVSANSNDGELGGGDGENNYDNINQLTYPIAFTTDGENLDMTSTGNVYYRPAQVKISDFSDDGYITIRPVSGELQTTDLDGGEVLQHYWKVTHSDFTTLPTVSYRFYFRNREEDGVADLPASTVDSATYVPGKVLSASPYTRSYESSSESDSDVNGVYSISADTDTYVIIFNGDNTGTTDDDLFGFSSDAPGFTLENASYTAGVPARFEGAPEIWYSRNNGIQNWNNEDKWTLNDDGSDDGATGYPQEGDVVIMSDYNNSGQQHWVYVNLDIQIAELVFDKSGTGWTPRVWVTDQTANLDLGIVSGTGQFYLECTAANTPSFIGDTDLGLWADESNSYFIYKIDANSNTVDMISNIEEYPNLRIEAGNGTDRVLQTSVPVVINGNVLLDRGSKWLVNHDAEIGGNLRVGWQEDVACEVEIGDDREVTLLIEGNLQMENGNGSGISIFGVKNDNLNGYEHTIQVAGDIAFESSLTSSSSFNLYNGTGTNNNAILELVGTGSYSFTNNSSVNVTPELYKIIMNKGSDTSSVFSFDDNFTLPTPADIGAQPIEIVNGLLIMNDADIDVTLADGTQGSFYLPNTLNSEAASGSGGLEMAQGIASISGDDTGIILDGLLRISGGTLDMSVTGDDGNNFIEYGASDNAIIEISDGSLLVGSQVRRKLTSVTGLLNYTQTGGVAQFGLEAAPESTRGVFEVTNSGSQFIHNGGEFTIVRQNGSSTVGSLIIKPDVDDFDVTGSTITIGSSDTPAGQSSIGIDSDRILNSLLVTGNNDLTAVIYNTDLEIDSLGILSGGTFDANGYDLTINDELGNDGTFTNGGTDVNQQTTYFDLTGTHTISGTGTTNFFNFIVDGSGTLNISKEITIDNDLSLLDGTINTSTYAVNVKGDMVHDAIHTCDATGPGIVFNGTDGQNLDTNTDTGEFGVLTMDNSNGLEIPGDGRIFDVNDKIVLSTGVFNIGGNLLIMAEGAYFENGSGGTDRDDFNVNSMISVNASITDNGVRKVFNDSYTGTYLYPLGLNYYTPAEVNVTSITGSDIGHFTIKPIEDIAGGIPDDSDETCYGDFSDYVDSDNILQFYWLIRSSNVTDFEGSIFLYHVDALEAYDNTQGLDLTNYAPARLLDVSSTWDKSYSADQFDETDNRIEFRLIGDTDYTGFTSSDIAGTYTAGITVESNTSTQLCGGAIPDVVPEYVTLSTASSGDVDDISSYETAPDGTVPALGESPDLTVAGDFTLNLTDEYWRFRKVVIEEGATLTVSGAGVNLGTVSGLGTLRLVDTNSLPAGDYTDFEADEACTTGGGFELQVSSGNSVDLSLPFNKLRRLIVSGDGEKVMTNGSSFDICENLEILDAGTLTLGDNTTLNIQGNIVKESTASFDGDYNNTEIILDGDGIQQIDGSFVGAEAFISLELDNASGLTVVNTNNDDIEVENMVLTSGKVTTNADNSLIILSTGSITGSFSSTTFVDGPLIRRLETSNNSMLFPVGDGSVYLPFAVSNTQGYTGTKDWTVQYYDDDPGTTSEITNVNATYDFTTWEDETNDANSELFREDVFRVEVASPAKADVRPYWDSDSDVGSDASSWQYLRVMVWNSTELTWESYGNANANYSGMSSSSGSVVSDTDLSFSTNYVTLGYNEPVPLPVELVYFKGELLDNGNVSLTWQTASEVNNDYFEVQRINSDGEFETVGTVNGAGDSNELIDYSYTDNSPYQGINYYRLKQVDFDGEYAYSNLVMIDNDTYYSGLDVTVYPNPVVGNEIGLLIKTGDELSDLQFVLLDGSGRVLKKSTQSPVLGTANYELALANQQLGSGLFYLVVVQGDNKQVVRVIIY